MLPQNVLMKLEKLREFDSMIDFSRSRLQLDIVLQLAASRNPLSAADIAKALGQRKKPVLDALRKLELKGFIKRVSDRENVYELTDLGRQMIEDLMAILGISDLNEVIKMKRRYDKVEARDLLKIVIPVNYLYDVLIALGTSRSMEMDIRELSRVAGISPQRLAMYIEPYTDTKSEVRLFKKVHKETLLTRIRNMLLGGRKTVTVYRLTNLGREIFYKLPIYMKIKNDPIIRLVTRVFGNYSPKLVIYRLSLGSVVASSVLTAVLLLLPQVALTVAAVWLITWLLLGTLLLLAYGR